MQDLAGDFFTKAAAPLAALLGRNAEAAKNISAVEVLGGGIRVPRLQSVIKDTLGGQELSKYGLCLYGRILDVLRASSFQL